MTERMAVSLKGDILIMDRLKALEHASGLAKIALVRMAEKTMTKAKELTPVDTGALRASGHVQRPEEVGYEIRVRLGFGGAAAPYAIIVHERTDVHHPVGQAKFLESALLQNSPRVAIELRRALDEFTRQWRVGSGWAAEIDRATRPPSEASGAA